MATGMMNENEMSEWVGLRRAADILGVHPATVRNWADRGKLPFRRTAGQHRRFSIRDLRHYAQTQGDIRPMELQIILQNALGQARMQVGSQQMEQAAWYIAMSSASKQRMSEQGRRSLEAIRAYVAAPDEGLSAAIALGKDYADHLIQDGLSLSQALRGFFYFSDFVLDSILTWRELPHHSPEWSALLRQVKVFTHTMLLSIVERYEAD